MKKLGKRFFYLILGQGISRFGNNLFTLALLWYVLDETGSSMYVGLTAILLTIPNILSMFTGTFVDRINRWKVMITVEVVQIVLTLMIAIIGWNFGIPIILLVVFTLLIQAAGSFFGPAENAVIPLLVRKKENLTMANSLNQLVTMVSKIVGLATGGILLNLVGPFTLIFINCLTFLCSLLSILAIRPWSSAALYKNVVENKEGESSSLFKQWKQGLQSVLRNETLRKIIAIAILVNFSLAPLMSLNPAWVKEVLKLNASAYGFVEASMFVGVITGIIMVNFLHKLIPYHRLIPLFLFIMASSVILLSLAPLYYVTILCMVLFGVAAGIINTGVFTIMQWMTPNSILGRVSGILIGATNISLPLGMALGSIMSSYVPIAVIYFSGGLIAIIGAVIGIYLPDPDNEGSAISTDDVERTTTKGSF